MLVTSCQYFYCKIYIIYHTVLYYFFSNGVNGDHSRNTTIVLATVAVSILL